jgi:KaiC.
LKEQAVKNAIIESVDIVENVERRPEIREKIETALTKDIRIDLGLDYFGDLGDRLRRIFTASDIRIPTYYPQFDEYINGGFPSFTLSVLTARIHGFKSNTMANFAARQVLHGHNVVVMTLEMAQDAFAQRFDSIYTGLDINRIYTSNSDRNRLARKLAEVKL